MYVKGSDIQRGLMEYINADMLPKLDGWKRVVFGACITLMNEQDLTKEILDNPMINMLGVRDVSGKIEIDRVKKAIEDQMKDDKYSIDVPMVGTFSFSQPDIEKICVMIKTGGGNK